VNPSRGAFDAGASRGPAKPLPLWPLGAAFPVGCEQHFGGPEGGAPRAGHQELEAWQVLRWPTASRLRDALASTLKSYMASLGEPVAEADKLLGELRARNFVEVEADKVSYSLPPKCDA